MALKDQILVSAVWVDSAARFANTSGTMLASAADNGSGEALADEYSLVASAVSGGTGTITVQTLSPNNPYKGRVATGVALDGATVYTNIIPGVNLVFANTTANTNASTVFVGVYAGTFDAFGVGAGTPSTPVRHKVVNDGTGAVANAKAQCRTQAIQYKKTGSVFAYVRPFADGATEKQQGSGSTRTMPYALSITGTAGAGSAKTANLLVDGVVLGAATILDLSTGTSVSGTGLKAISPAYPYRITSGPLTGLEFALDPNCANGDIANVLIFPSRYVQIAPDAVGGVPGTWGTTDVVLTQSGQAAGVIQPAGEAYYHTRIVVPAGAGSESNPHPTNVALSGTETGSANWAG
jgi:hypothetical protein